MSDPGTENKLRKALEKSLHCAGRGLVKRSTQRVSHTTAFNSFTSFPETRSHTERVSKTNCESGSVSNIRDPAQYWAQKPQKDIRPTGRRDMSQHATRSKKTSGRWVGETRSGYDTVENNIRPMARRDVNQDII